MRRLRRWRKDDVIDDSPLQFAPDLPEVLPRFTRLLADSDQTLVFLDDTSLLSRRAESMTLATLGRFSASLAHEIRNPLAAISYATPLFTVMLAALLLKEVVRIYRWTAVTVGLGGILIILSPHAFWDISSNGSAALIGGIFGLSAAFFSAVSMIQIRHLTQTENTGAIIFYFTMFTTVIGLASTGLGWEMPTAWQWTLLIGAGLVGGIAQILVTLSLRYAEASLLAPFDYTTMIWALLIGYSLMDQVPAVSTLVGAAIVVAAGLFTLWREQRIRKKRIAEQVMFAAP